MTIHVTQVLDSCENSFLTYFHVFIFENSFGLESLIHSVFKKNLFYFIDQAWMETTVINYHAGNDQLDKFKLTSGLFLKYLFFHVKNIDVSIYRR